MTDYWLKQEEDKPLFPELIWSKPENKNQAGKLLIIGGNQYGFVNPAEAFKAAEDAGIGQVKMLLPDSLKKYIGEHFEGGELAPSTPSGSFSQRALDQAIDMSEWADGVLLAGDFGHNSETAMLLEKFTQKYEGLLTLVGDSLDYFYNSPSTLTGRDKTTLVVNLAQLQKLSSGLKSGIPLLSTMGTVQIVEWLHDFSSNQASATLLINANTVFIAYKGKVSTTKIQTDTDLVIAAQAAVWHLQNPGKTFEALTSSVLVL